MYSINGQNAINRAKKWQKEVLSDTYNRVAVYEKIINADILGAMVSIDLLGVDIFRLLEKGEDLSFIANQILENVDDVINFKTVNYADGSEYSYYGFVCKTSNNVQVNININFSLSENCNVEYEDVTIKKAILKCV